MRDYFIRFATDLDPYGKDAGKHGAGVPWPKYEIDDPQSLLFQDSIFRPLKMVDDNYRVEELKYVVNLSLTHPI